MNLKFCHQNLLSVFRKILSLLCVCVCVCMFPFTGIFYYVQEENENVNIYKFVCKSNLLQIRAI